MQLQDRLRLNVIKAADTARAFSGPRQDGSRREGNPPRSTAMNLFTSDLFTPVMLEGLASRAPRSYRAPAFGRRYGRASESTARAAPALPLTACTVEAIGDEHVLLDYDLAA